MSRKYLQSPRAQARSAVLENVDVNRMRVGVGEIAFRSILLGVWLTCLLYVAAVGAKVNYKVAGSGWGMRRFVC